MALQNLCVQGAMESMASSMDVMVLVLAFSGDSDKDSNFVQKTQVLYQYLAAKPRF